MGSTLEELLQLVFAARWKDRLRDLGSKWIRCSRPCVKCLGLTVSSSATEAGEKDVECKKKTDRQPLFAGARG